MLKVYRETEAQAVTLCVNPASKQVSPYVSVNQGLLYYCCYYYNTSS